MIQINEIEIFDRKFAEKKSISAAGEPRPARPSQGVRAPADEDGHPGGGDFVDEEAVERSHAGRRGYGN